MVAHDFHGWIMKHAIAVFHQMLVEAIGVGQFGWNQMMNLGLAHFSGRLVLV